MQRRTAVSLSLKGRRLRTLLACSDSFAASPVPQPPAGASADGTVRAGSVERSIEACGSRKTPPWTSSLAEEPLAPLALRTSARAAAAAAWGGEGFPGRALRLPPGDALAGVHSSSLSLGSQLNARFCPRPPCLPPRSLPPLPFPVVPFSLPPAPVRSAAVCCPHWRGASACRTSCAAARISGRALVSSEVRDTSRCVRRALWRLPRKCGCCTCAAECAPLRGGGTPRTTSESLSDGAYALMHA